ncbi:MAG: IS110 family transposase, partial [Collinsella sp.]|nr:IS110 family transposase [Collinsella sp.]
FCGVDTHADSHWLCVLDWRGRKVLSRQFPADAAGYEALAGAIAAAGGGRPASRWRGRRVNANINPASYANIQRQSHQRSCADRTNVFLPI